MIFLAGFVAGAGVIMIVWILSGIKMDMSDVPCSCSRDAEGAYVVDVTCPRHGVM